ncbi:uncharacterized protein LOC114298532 [Camellia sinensis]|uniref:uncharacterized protein LOC114298532 n=1 Tax=Camellia sinensis TaxID=4442 RepID=UPI001036AE65|nr:uncharacterized protein LOC114298532 [Camellia sinensis]
MGEESAGERSSSERDETEHPGNKIERFYWSVSANEVMSANPDHYVTLVMKRLVKDEVTAESGGGQGHVGEPRSLRHTCRNLTSKSENRTPVKQLKLLRPDDTLLIGQVYRLISFEDVLKEFAAKKCVKLGKLLQRGALAEEIAL